MTPPLPVERARFRRGPDRRAAGENIAIDRRVGQRDRRNAGLGSLALFRGTDEASVVAAIGECDVLALPAGTPLLKSGEANDKVFLLLAGQLGAYIDSSQSADAAILIQTGESVGELSASDGKPVSALVVALTDARVLVLPQELLWGRLNAVPGVTRNLLAAVAERMRSSNAAMLEAQRRRLALEHIRKELDVARQLQSSMLPLRRPMFPDRQDIEIAASMEPASEVGGDLFDAFFVDDKNLFFCIGDVSGHGIPAALFMARTIGLMRIAAMSTRRPDRLLQRINDQLCAGNDSTMFVTLFFGVLEIATGRLVYTNGGHCAPVVVDQGHASLLPIPKGALVGAMPGLRYTANEIVLPEGATLLCFTDGVTEAQTEAGEEFSEVRLLAITAMQAAQSLETLLDTVRAAVTDFTGHRALADDCTMLALRRPVKP